jgi:type I restriction enzyme S subunit
MASWAPSNHEGGILDLAVRGRLTTQDPSDEPASELLKRIQAEKARGVRASGKRAESFVEESEPPFAVPTGWLWLGFGSIHDLVRGVTYTKSDVAESQGPGYLPILRANNIGASLNFENPVYVRSSRVGPDQMLRRGDYLIALSRGSKNLVGKAVFVAENYPGGFGGFCGVIRLVSPALEPYVGVFLASRLYRDAIAAGSRGIGINNLKREILNNIPFPSPPSANKSALWPEWMS